MQVAELILVGLSLFYGAAVLWIRAGLRRIPSERTLEQPMVSVIVAARNEEKHLPALLDALAAQDYPRSCTEFIIVDDESEDATAALVEAYPDERFILLHSRNRNASASPKKQALDLGIKTARGEILLLTDADCLPPPNWLSDMVGYFTPDTGMVIGFSPAELPLKKGFFPCLMQLDSLSLAAIAAGSSGWNAAATCNGRNLAYRKSVYQQVGGFTRIQRHRSGDDDLLLGLVQTTEWKIRYAFDARVVVPTYRPQNFRHFVRQRLRHASKGFYYSPVKVAALIAAYGYHFILFTAPFLCGWMPFFFAMIFKLVVDFYLLHRFAVPMRRTECLRILPLAELLHVPYVVLFGAAGPFLSSKWK
ncbi:MAG: glycosyltransferase [candidate division KSB1 bacterium]|nr:glycosyltransferase [candidate division KSB1 bacterium]